MNAFLNLDDLPEQAEREIRRLIGNDKYPSLTIEELWKKVDQVWDDLECDNSTLNWEKIGLFYKHPVWLLNGLFSEQDKVSSQYRYAISDWISINRKNIASVIDYGGGFGSVARAISEREADLSVDIYEPYPHSFALEKLKPYSNIKFIHSLANSYDCLVSLDVLEHVPDPINRLREMISVVNVGGYLIIANHFHPVIKCHLPCTFHLRFTFNYLARLMGIKLLGACEGSHAFVYRKVSNQPLNRQFIEQAEQASRLLFPTLSAIYPIYQNFKAKFR